MTINELMDKLHILEQAADLLESRNYSSYSVCELMEELEEEIEALKREPYDQEPETALE
jgi:hypothetical protein